MKQLQEILKPYFAEGQTDYDITAVLKYISKHGCYRDVIGGEKISIMYGNELEPMEDFISNKPLNLYTEEEDKSLKDLLLKLK